MPCPMVDKLLSPIEAGIHPASKSDFFNQPLTGEGRLKIPSFDPSVLLGMVSEVEPPEAGERVNNTFLPMSGARF
jgi:hypothetical protein